MHDVCCGRVGLRARGLFGMIVWLFDAEVSQGLCSILARNFEEANDRDEMAVEDEKNMLLMF